MWASGFSIQDKCWRKSSPLKQTTSSCYTEYIFNITVYYEWGVGKRWSPKPWLWRHLAAAVQTTGHTAGRESEGWAVAARSRQSRRLGFHSFTTRYLNCWILTGRPNLIVQPDTALVSAKAPDAVKRQETDKRSGSGSRHKTPKFIWFTSLILILKFWSRLGKSYRSNWKCIRPNLT